MTSAENHLIALLPPADQRRLLAICEPIELTMGEVVCEPGVRLSHVYFPVTGFISLVALMQGSPGVEVGMVGHEGMVGAHLALGVDTAPLHGVVQGSGSCWRIATGLFAKELLGSDALDKSLNRYLYVLMAQQASAAACLRFHQIGPRLARWLLMTQDRAQSSSFHVTQAFLAYMLGVRRVGINSAARDLQQGGLIDYHRGAFRILDRSGLEAASCTCYARDLASYTTQLQ